MQKPLKEEYHRIVYIDDLEEWKQIIFIVDNILATDNDERFSSHEDVFKISTNEIAEKWRDLFRTSIILEIVRLEGGFSRAAQSGSSGDALSASNENQALERDANSVLTRLLAEYSTIQDADLSKIDREERWRGVFREGARFSVDLIGQIAGLLSGKKVAPIVAQLQQVVQKFSEAPENVWPFIESYMVSRGMRVALILNFPDSIDISDHRAVAAGFLRFVANPNLSDKHDIDVIVALPTESISSLQGLSRNPLADFSNRMFLHWQSDDLIRLAVRRLSTVLSLHETYNGPLRSISNEFDPNSDSLELNELYKFRLRQFLGLTPLDKNGLLEEDRLSFILRHTQMVPRHFLSILNNLSDRCEILADVGAPITESKLKFVVAQTASLICAEIFAAYNAQWPYAELICSEIIPELPVLFSFKDLQDLVNSTQIAERFQSKPFTNNELKSVANFDPKSVKKMLVEIGAIGRVSDRQHLFDNRTHYVHGDFDYSQPNSLRIHQDFEMCVHPIFSLTYSAPTKNNAAVIIIPSASNVHPLIGRERHQLELESKFIGKKEN